MSEDPEIVSVLPPMHPGEVLQEEFLNPFGLSPYALAKALRIPRTRIERIVTEKIGITGDTALRLSAYFGNSPEFWMNLQKNYELEIAMLQIGENLKSIEAYCAENDY
jgi:addiction module HigA family antidote